MGGAAWMATEGIGERAMSIDQFIDTQLTVQARRAWLVARDRARDIVATVEAYRRAFETAREFRRAGG
jgi:hypothetical protein